MTAVSDVAAAVRSFRFRFGCEDDLQAAIAEGLTIRGFTVEREVRIAGGRIDLTVDGTVGIEVKLTGSHDAVVRQIDGYLHGPELAGLILVTAHAAHQNLPLRSNGKPVRVVFLAGAGL